MPTEVIDAGGKPITVGSRVAPWSDERVSIPGGEVIEITDPDGDVNDEGQVYGINPFVVVRYDDGSQESFSTTWTAQGWWDEGAPYQCEDVDVEA